MLITFGFLATLAMMHLASRRRAATVHHVALKSPPPTSSKRQTARPQLRGRTIPALQSVRESAKATFVSLQRANDQGDLDTLRAGLSTELFEVVRRDVEGRREPYGPTEFVDLEAQVLHLVPHGSGCAATVWFTGRRLDPSTKRLIQMDEVWRLIAPQSAPAAWRVTAIQLH